MARSILAFFPLILTAGAIVLLLFVVLAGITDTVPFNKTWFVSADLSRITGSGVNSPSGTFVYSVRIINLCALSRYSILNPLV